MSTLETDFLDSVRKLFENYKKLGEKTIEQLPDALLFGTFNEESNSIAVLVKHLSGNMLSRWTNFLTSDGEKEWRDREAEFVNDIISREEMLERWHKGWECLFKALDELKPEDLGRIVYIRNEGHTVMEAIHRQLAHYSYHVGQMVYIGKMALNDKWKSLSIPRGGSQRFNQEKFGHGQHRAHFTDDPGSSGATRG